MNGMVTFALKQRVLLLLAFTFVVGAFSVIEFNIEAHPGPVPPLVDIVTQSTGQSAEEIDRSITMPIEIQMAGIPHVAMVRTISAVGLSDVKMQFTDDFTYAEAEHWVVNRLSQLAPLPNGVQPQISPEGPIGGTLRYQVVGPSNYSVTDLKTIEDWILERRLKAVPGVIDASGWSGRAETYDVTIDRNRLVSYGITLPQVLQILDNSNSNVGGQTVNFGPQSAVVRGIGLIHSMDDVRKTMLTSNNGTPVLLSDVATISVGGKPRLGIAGHDDEDDTVEGIVLMRRGEQSMPTIKRVEAEIDRINMSGILPPGVHIDRIYDRSDLINPTTHTVLHNTVIGMLVISVLQWLFLGNLRSAVTVSPVLCGIFLPEQADEKETFRARLRHRIYRPVAEFALDNKILTLGCVGILLALAGLAVQTLGGRIPT